MQERRNYHLKKNKQKKKQVLLTIQRLVGKAVLIKINHVGLIPCVNYLNRLSISSLDGWIRNFPLN